MTGANCDACGDYVPYDDKDAGAAVDVRTGDVFCPSCADRIGPIRHS
jgi:uncharacterized Zn finger protein (UPF0148 family)